MSSPDVDFPVPDEQAATPDRELSFPLDPASPTPLHAQLASVMRNKIAAREWARGSYIPSESELMASYGVSRGTVRRAIGALTAEGLLVSRKGSGTVVADGRLKRPGNAKSFSFATSLRESGLRYTTRVLLKRVQPAPTEVANSLQIKAGAPVLFMRRVRSVGSRPVVCQESWSNLDACPGLADADFEQESLFDAVERCSGKKISYSHARYIARTAGPEHGRYLECSPDAPVIALEQQIELVDATPIEWSMTWIGPGQSIVGVSVEAEGQPGPLELGSAASLLTRGDQALAGEKNESADLRRKLEREALRVRRGVVELAHQNSSGPFHVGGACSMAEIVAVLFGHILRTGRDGTPWEERDRFVVSKAHASIALYPAMLDAGLISREDVDRGFFGPDAVIFKHPARDVSRGFEMSGGSLGMGLGYAGGLALSLRRRHLPSRVFCIVGDGECDEGSVWEAAAFIGHMHLVNLTVIVDANGMQLDGPTSSVLDNGPINRKFASFGFEVVEVDGHDVLALANALAATSDRPRAIVARTVKGKGLSFAENRVEWHDMPMDDEHYAQAMRDLDAREAQIDNE